MNLFNTFSVTTIDQNIADWFNGNFGLGGDWSWGNLILCIIAIILTVALTGCIGYEREKKGRTAGLRTHIIVGVGSCIIMIISIYGFPQFGASRDVARLAAGIVCTHEKRSCAENVFCIDSVTEIDSRCGFLRTGLLR